MDVSCAFPPVPETPDHIALAERLGYKRAWAYDTPALQLDVWVTLCRAAERTERIGLGPAAIIPNLRHVVTTAAAIATLFDLAPGRVNVVLGSGFTGRLAMGQRPLTWEFVGTYGRQLKELLEGGTVEVVLSQAIRVELSRYLTGSSDLSLEGFPQLAQDLALTDMQRERIEHWLAWKKGALDALGGEKNPQAIREIDQSTAEAVRAELDFFQGEMFNKQLHESARQTASIRLLAAESLNRNHLEHQGLQTSTRWVNLVLENGAK